MILRLLVPALLIASLATAPAAVFTIENIRVDDTARTNGEGIVATDSHATSPLLPPQVEVDVNVSENAQSRNLVSKLYIYDDAGHLLQKLDAPAPARRRTGNDAIQQRFHVEAWPALIPAHTRQTLYFPLPANLPDDVTVLAVFGNANGAVAATLPPGREATLAYTERDLVARTNLAPDVALTDDAAPAPLIEERVESENPRCPAFTLLVHLPHGVNKASEVSGVMAVCMPADSVASIRNRLNAIKPEGDPDACYAYAEGHRLAVLAWGARWVWDSYANFDELDRDQLRGWDADFEQIADAWDRGVQHLVEQDGLPDHDFLMYGICAGGEWAHRLALHKPDRFLAVHLHISTSYDAPTPEGARVLWLVTTGELDSGCDRARRFYAAAHGLGYPIIFKAIPDLGHQTSAAAARLELRFFDYALAQKARRDAATPDHARAPALDLSAFAAPPFYGDLMNQDMCAAADRAMIPPEFLVPLPTREIADAWNH